MVSAWHRHGLPDMALNNAALCLKYRLPQMRTQGRRLMLEPPLGQRLPFRPRRDTTARVASKLRRTASGAMPWLPTPSSSSA
jgi:hypothetical protein